MNDIKPIAIPGIHESFYKIFKDLAGKYNKPKILEVGAGHGAFTRKLYNDGYDVSANDFFPENFYFDKVSCLQVDITKDLPYDTELFDMVIAIEVMEHIHDHSVFFRECNRILKPGGMLIISTPNILSLKSRVRYLFSGFYYSFGPLDHARNDGLQHLSGKTVDQFENLSVRSNFSSMKVFIDKRQNTSVIYSFLIPLLWLYCKLKKINYRIHNNWDLLTGRILIIAFNK
ncbi:MAG: class I SAM-dependent methyltransferase [Bacteroidales bacterium]|nr:class I SAM-dependent methyltransferase [Bacteroidales bacterium]